MSGLADTPSASAPSGEFTPRVVWHRTPLRQLVRSALWLIALAIVGVPILIAVMVHEHNLEFGPQYTTDPAALSAADLARWRAAAGALPEMAPPVVLVYHEIRYLTTATARADVAARELLVAPERFDAQLSALQRAGYSSLTAAQYVSYLRDRRLPPRSVLITFDGGAQGLWEYADGILARHHMHAVAFLPIGSIGSHWSKFLSWPELSRLQASGRWDFEPYANAASPGAVATGGEAAASALRAHHLPAAQLLAFHPAGTTNAASIAGLYAAVRRSVSPEFPALFASEEGSAAPTSRRAASQGIIGRIDVTGTTDADALLRSVVSFTAIPVGPGVLTASAERWTLAGGVPAPVSLAGGTLSFTGAAPRVTASFAPDATPDWDHYVLTARVRRLNRGGANEGAVTVRVGSAEPLTLRISAREVTVVNAAGAASKLLRHARLIPAGSHTVRIVVDGASTVFSIDRLIQFTVPGPAGAATTGGVALGCRHGARTDCPEFAALTVNPATPGATQNALVHQILPSSHPNLANPALWLRDAVARASVRAIANGLTFDGGGSYDFAELPPEQTSSWVGYAFSTALQNLPLRGAAEIFGRLGGRNQVVAIVDRHWVKVFWGSQRSRTLVTSHALPASSTHVLSMRVLKNSTVVTIDGTVVATVHAQRGSTGGIGLGAYRRDAEPWPTFARLAVAPAR